MAIQFSDSDASRAYEDIYNGTSESDWAIFEYVPGKKNDIQVREVGSGGINALFEKLQPDMLSYCFVRLIHGDKESRRTKFVYLTWVGEEVKPMLRARVSFHKSSVANLLKGFHVEYYATSKEDLDEGELMKKIKMAMGADYDARGTAEAARTKEEVPPVPSETKEEEPKEEEPQEEEPQEEEPQEEEPQEEEPQEEEPKEEEPKEEEN
eukprot:TRINITY_DN161_c0_g1_i4.p1 TRINITY_DN161_c0_g1~~TRINITY_DN161_c0_g1_i4.p1  ORF type:complete len:209 (-),score=84.74 TRINITY_DN161_c0_g1_i4:133-759(-)